MPTPFERIRIPALAVACFALTTAVPSPASADAGIPLIALLSPIVWLVLPLVVLLEGVLALLILRKGVWTALRVSVVSNLVSTLAGIPLRWLLVLLFTPFAEQQEALLGQGAYASGNFITRFAFTMVDAPLGFSGTPGKWLSESRICWGILLIPFLALSIWIEGRIAARLVGKEYRRRARCWAWVANAVSYVLLFTAFLRLLSWIWLGQ